jgi:hypothetical protein
MAVREELVLDLSRALSQIDDLERQLDGLLQPITIPVKVESDQALDKLRADIRAADDDDIDVDVDVDGVTRAEDEFEELRREVDQTEDGLRDVERQANRTGDDLERAGKRGGSAFSGLTKGVLAFGAALGGIAALRGLASFFGDAIDSASDLEESTSKAQVVFGEFFDDIEQFASTAPQALGLANSAALEFTGTFGNLFVALGLSQQAAADLAPDIVQLGSDLASFNNLEVTEALDKLRAGLVGEAEPLRALGVNLTAAATASKAVELGLVGANGELSEAAKVQARYALILEQTTTAQGDFARTSDGIANQQRTLNAEFENFRATVGEALLPAFQAILDITPAIVAAIEDGLVPAIASMAAGFASVDTDGFINAVGQLPSAVGATFSGLSSFAQGVGNVGQAFVSLITLDIPGFFRQAGESADDFNNIFAQQTARQAIQNLIVTMQAGTEPGEAFESVLIELGKTVNNLDVDEFESLVDQLLAISDLDDTDIARLIPLLTQLGTEAGFSEAGVQILVTALLEARSAAGELPPPVDEIARALADVGDAAATSIPLLSGFGEGVAKIADADIDGLIADLETQFERLPDGLDAAAAALRDAENEIVTDFTDFLTNLETELEARAAFADNIAILRLLGLDDLADVFADAGLEAAAALADAVANPEEARRAEQLLDDAARSQAERFTTTFLGEIANFVPTEGLTIPVNILAKLEGVTFGNLPALPNLVVGGGSVNRPGGPNQPTINQFFDNTPSSTTETTRAAQAVSSLIN